MKKIITYLSVALLSCSNAFAATVQGDADSNGALDVNKGGTNATSAANARTALGVPAIADAKAGDCTILPCFDGTTGSGTYFKLLGTDGTHWSAIQAGNVLANITHRLPLILPAAGTTRLINTDEYGNWGLVDPASLGGTVDAAGFNGNLATTDDTLQEIAQKVDDLVLGGAASISDTAYDATGWNGVTTTAPSKNAVRDWIESLPSLVISTGLTDNSGTVSVTNPVTAEAFSGSGWNADTEGLTRNDAYDYLHIADTDDDGLPNKVDLSSAGMVKVDSSGVLSIATAGTDYEASTPSTKIVATTAGISEADLLAAKYVSNYGASGTVIMTLPAPSYNISRAFISEAAQIIQVKPPSGEALSTPIGTQTADEVVAAPASVGNVLVATRYKTGAATWAWRVDPVNGVWSESGGLVINAPTFGGVTIADSGIITFDEAAQDPDDADIQLSATDGVFKVASVNGANNENLTIDLDQTANTAIIGSSSGLTMVTTGSIPFTGAVNVIAKSTDYTIGTDNANEAYGSMFFNTAASTRTFTLPAAAAGMAVCVRNAQGVAQILRLDAGTGDYIVKSTGARTTSSGQYYGATADAKNQVCVVAYDATDWYVTSETGTWAGE